MITSQATVRNGADAIVATPSPHPKCERCWHYRADVGADPAHPDHLRPLRVESPSGRPGETRRFA